jgi:prepilin-type N-terminal cleavage/methylation domain-containing protein
MSRGRRGFTLIELLVALVLLGLVSAALYRILVNNQRLYMAQTQRIDLSQNVRAAGSILPAELRELSASEGDIIAMSPTSITIRAMRWLSFVCQIPVLGGPSWNGLQMIIRGGAPGQMGFYGARGLQNSDSLLVYWDGNQTNRLDDYWPIGGVVASAPVNCPGVPVSPGTLVTFNASPSPVPFATANVAGAITVGAPVRGWERVTYSLFQSPTDGQWYVGFQPAGQTMQPLIGPLLANGLQFDYYAADGSVTAVRTQVARIDLTVRARTANAIRKGGQAAAAIAVDSVVTSVALRNNRRF